MPLRSKCRPIAAFTMPIPSAPLTASHEPRGFYNDAARRVATVFERLNCVIETSLPVRNASYKRLPPPVFRRVPFWEYGGLNPIRPFLGGRSDAARRVVILPFAVPVDAHVGANDGRWRCIATESPPMPTVGAGSSQREDSPARRPLYAQTTHGAQRFLSRHGKGGHAALVREGTRCARHLPYQERNSQSRKLIEM